MPDKVVQTIPGVDFGFSANDKFVTFRFLGKASSVRIAARDALFGLKIIGGVEGGVRFISDENLASFEDAGQFWGTNAQIDIWISTRAHDRLLLMYRYCHQIGIKFSGSAGSMEPGASNSSVPFFSQPERYFWSVVNEDGSVSQACGILSAYLDALKDLAKADTTPIVIPAYPRPECSLLWSQEELDAECARLEAICSCSHTVSSSSSEAVNGDASLRIARKAQIKDMIEFMVRKDPRVIYASPAAVRYEYLEWISEAMRRGENPFDPALACERYTYIQRTDMAKFLGLLQEYHTLSTNEKADYKEEHGSGCFFL